MNFEVFQNIMTASDPAGGRAIKVTTQTGVDDAESYYTKSDPAGGRAIKVKLLNNPVNTGVLQMAGGVDLSSTLTNVTDQSNNASTLYLSTNQVKIGSAANDTPLALFGNKNIAAIFNTIQLTGTDKTFTFPDVSMTFAGINIAQTFTAANIFSVSGAASTPALSLTGTPFVGTGTTSVPLFYLNNGTAPTSWNNSANGGTFIGVNASATFAGNFIDFRQGGVSLFSVNVFGGFQTGINATSTFRGNLQTQNSFTILNKAQVSYITFMTRNTAAAEVVMDFTNVGTLAAAGAISIGNTVAAGVGVASTHKVTMVIGGTTYYLLASNV